MLSLKTLKTPSKNWPLHPHQTPSKNILQTPSFHKIVRMCLDMGDLPEEWLIEEPPFSYCGVEMFGPCLIKGCKIHKKYGNVYMLVQLCCSYRDNSLTTDSFIQALKRLISRRGIIRIIWSNNGSNFVGAGAELKMAFNDMGKKKTNNFLMELEWEWLIWKHNPSTKSNMGECGNDR